MTVDLARVEAILARARAGAAGAAELEALADWRRTSPDHERQYGQLVRLLEASRALGSSHEGGADPIPAAARPAAAAIIALAEHRSVERREGQDSGGRDAAAAGRPREAARSNASVQARISVHAAGLPPVRRLVPWVLAAAATIVAVVSVGRSRPASGPAAEWRTTEVVTGAGELATVTLGEGSVVRLGPSSRLRAVAGARERVMAFEGRAFFAVAHVPGRPMRVHTPAGEARVVGTRFELAADSAQLRLRVVEGRVVLRTRRADVAVRAGEESGARDGSVQAPSRVPPAAPVAEWAGTFLAFQATPLRDVAAEIERVYRTRVAISDSTLLAETITATFTDQPLSQVVNVVCAVLGARCVVEGREVEIGR